VLDQCTLFETLALALHQFEVLHRERCQVGRCTTFHFGVERTQLTQQHADRQAVADHVINDETKHPFGRAQTHLHRPQQGCQVDIERSSGEIHQDPVHLGFPPLIRPGLKVDAFHRQQGIALYQNPGLALDVDEAGAQAFVPV
jgi:hypothetical protein